jgi:hypothetical protein
MAAPAGGNRRRKKRRAAEGIRAGGVAPGGGPPATCPFPAPPGLRYKTAMHSYEVMREVLKSTSAKQISADLNLSLSLIYKWAEAPDPAALTQSFNPLDRVDQLYQSTHDPRIIHWLCERAGGFFIKNPRTTHAHPDFLIPATNQIVQDFADLLAVVAGAAADNSISADEAKKIRKRWEELKSVTETFVHCCEQGNFTALKEVPPVQT